MSAHEYIYVGTYLCKGIIIDETWENSNIWLINNNSVFTISLTPSLSPSPSLSLSQKTVWLCGKNAYDILMIRVPQPAGGIFTLQPDWENWCMSLVVVVTMEEKFSPITKYTAIKYKCSTHHLHCGQNLWPMELHPLAGEVILPVSYPFWGGEGHMKKKDFNWNLTNFNLKDIIRRFIFAAFMIFSRIFQRKILANRLALVGMAGGQHPQLG